MRVFAGQPRSLPDGPIGVFLRVQALHDVPEKVASIDRRLMAKEIDASDAVEALTALVRQQEQATLLRR